MSTLIFNLQQQIKFAIVEAMKKQMIIDYLGSAPEIARRLDYAHRNVVYGWPDILTERILADIIRRMKAARIKVPADWGVR